MNVRLGLLPLLVVIAGEFGCRPSNNAAIPTVERGPDSKDRCERLWPTIGRLNDYLIDEIYENRDRRIRRQLHSQDASSRVHLIQMVRDDFRDNVEVVYLVEGESTEGTLRDHTVVYVRATDSASSGAEASRSEPDELNH